MKRCPLKHTKPPITNCPLGENLFKSQLDKKSRCSCKDQVFDFNQDKCPKCGKFMVSCEWGINSDEYCYCVWNFLEQNQGSRTLDPEISSLLGLTVQRIGQIGKAALKSIKRIDKRFMNYFHDQYEKIKNKI